MDLFIAAMQMMALRGMHRGSKHQRSTKAKRRMNAVTGARWPRQVDGKTGRHRPPIHGAHREVMPITNPDKPPSRIGSIRPRPR